MKSLHSLLPILGCAPACTTLKVQSDVVAAVIVTLMLVPQSLAYAMLAGLPPQVGLCASLLPLIAHAIFGTSRALAVGPVAVVSLMTAAAVGQVAAPGSPKQLIAPGRAADTVAPVLRRVGPVRAADVAPFAGLQSRCSTFPSTAVASASGPAGRRMRNRRARAGTAPWF